MAGHSEGSPPLIPSDKRQGSYVPLRQQLSICLPMEPGGHSLIAHVMHNNNYNGRRVLPNMGDPPGVPAAQYHPVSETHHKSSEYPSQWLLRRHQVMGTEWSLHRSIVHQMFSI